ncbi:MAG: S8 family serine peptidase, partial [Candidatus Aenigmarchaeota archaeon]|nr:S8 family serine peptidase [Candidatus Aenigmarchaeota archaeon]
GWDFVNTDNNPTDDESHGTHCSGIAAAQTNNSVGMAGVCWNCTIMPVKCLDNVGDGLYTDVALAIQYAANNSADVISLSLGGEYDSNLVEDAVNYAYSKGIVVIAAAGNSYTDDKHYPAAYDNAFAVTATTTSDSKADFSTYGYWTDIGAPGTNIYSTIPNNLYASWDGTSMATPFVAGLAGLLLSKNNSLNQEMIETIIKSTSAPFASGPYRGIGRINAYKALLKADSTIIAKINDSIKGNIYGGFITINGTANGTYFANYSLYYGSGIYPSSWNHISTYTAVASNENLSIWNSNGLSDGTYTIKLIVNDTNNNFFIDYAVLTLDNNPPQINIISPLNQSYQTPAIWFNTTMNKAGSSCSYSVDGGANISINNGSLYNWSGLNTDIENGQHNVVFYCSDLYGNKNSTDPLWFSVSANTISNCSVLDVPNALYYMTADILDSSDNACINISAENITVECQNHAIDGINTVGTYGIFANNINATVRNCQISNWYYGIYLYNSDDSDVYNSIIDSNYDGLYLTYSSNNEIFYNVVKNSSNFGIYIDNSGSNGVNNIYNNLLNNTNNTKFGGIIYSNNYNTTNAGGNRIYSVGNNIGGNYYTNSTGNDYSDTCADVDKNGFCDSSYS